jgi:hypothetical protein
MMRDESLPKIHPKYQGTLTYYNDLPIGTKFWVCNGCWTGLIVEVEGAKKLHVLDTDQIHEIYDNSFAWIEIYKS